MTQNTEVYDKFEYYLEDTGCSYCLHYIIDLCTCSLETCCYKDIKNEAIAHGRIKRKPGWNECLQ